MKEKTEIKLEIQENLSGFWRKYIPEEYLEYSLKLLGILCRKRTLDICRGQPAIWSSAIVYVIARLNFLQQRLPPSNWPAISDPVRRDSAFLKSPMLSRFIGHRKVFSKSYFFIIPARMAFKGTFAWPDIGSLTGVQFIGAMVMNDRVVRMPVFVFPGEEQHQRERNDPRI